MLGLKFCSTNIKTQNMNVSILKTFKIVLASFQIKNKLEKLGFSKKPFY